MSGTEPVSPALARRFFTSEPPGKLDLHLILIVAETECWAGRRRAAFKSSDYLARLGKDIFPNL